MTRWILAAASLAALVLLSCSDDAGGRLDAAVLPSGPAFQPVAEVMVERCGSLDCHGSKYRNMRLYGFGGARLDPNDRPDAPGRTTPAESDRDFDAVVSVEPEKIRAVAAEKGNEPERLTFVRKGRGAEAHKGGVRIFENDDADRCIRSWLAGAVNPTVCRTALARP